MLMFEMDFADPKYDEIGIWQGMSGSPVYAADGRLVGAVAYGLVWGPSLVAGVTPYEEMDNYMETPAAATSRTVEVNDAKSRTIARETTVTREQASDGFRQLPMPLGITGRMSADRMDAVTSKRRYIHRQAGMLGAADAAPTSTTTDLVAGGNLGAAVAHGDITAGGTGTVTSVCGDRIVGFGHPMTFTGDTTLTLHSADAVYVQGDPVGPGFKVANFGAPTGTITDDHLSGISGVFDALPDTMDVTSALNYRDRQRTGTTHVSLPQANAEMTFYQQLVNHDRVLDGIIAGSEIMEWTISGTDADGSPFSLGSTERFASDYDIAFESPWEVADIVWVLSALQGVTIDSVDIASTVDDDNSTWKVSSVEQRRNGAWTKVTRRKPAIAPAGGTLKLRAVLEGAEATRTVPLRFEIPRRALGARGGIEVVGGASSWSWPGEVNSVEDMEDYVANLVRNDTVQAQMFLEMGRRGLNKQTASPAVDKVVVGHKRISVRVR